MDPIVESLIANRVNPTAASRPVEGSSAVKSPCGFESLLEEAARGVDRFKQQASRPPELPERPEEMQEILAEVERNFQSCLQVGQDLVKAYQATLGSLGSLAKHSTDIKT